MSKSWFFQANPSIYRIRDALASLTKIRWAVRQHQSEIHTGDTVYLWETGTGGGLLAQARVTSEPGEGIDLREEIPYYVTPPTEENSFGVGLDIERVFPNPLKRADLQGEPALADTSLIVNPRGTNFPLTDCEAETLRQLLVEKPTFRDVVRRYANEHVVYSSPERGALYCITSVDERGCDVARLSAQEPARVTFSLHDVRVESLQKDGVPREKSFLDNTVTVIATLLQSPEMALNAERKLIVGLDSETKSIDHFCELVARLNCDDPGFSETGGAR